MNPYQSLPDAAFWRRSVSRVPVHQVDPGGVARFGLTANDRIATAGSCFAQHVARRLPAMGLSYLCTEDDATLAPAEREARQFGLFSARYGNIYTVTQLLQLVEEAFGMRPPSALAWRSAAGRWVDALRPSIEPGGFADEAAVAAARADHLDAVRRLVLELDVLVFTLGLTEAWRHREDGHVLPLAPGVLAGAFDEQRYEFVNFDATETERDLSTAVTLIRRLNPRARFILTVSPVPLIATYGDRGVIAATCYSKSVLRVAAEMVSRKFEFVDYFPSYEIITSSATGGIYFEEDRREVRPAGVAHVMRAFRGRYFPEAPTAAPVGEVPAGSIICDEEAIERARSAAKG